MNPAYAAVARRAEHRCEYCHAPEVVFNFPLEVEHIVPPQRGGSEGLNNLALACRACNLYKSDVLTAIDPVKAVTVRLFDPRSDKRLEHFTASNSGEIIGLTESGRATIKRLRFNTPLQVTARKAWMRLALFP